mgnify:CR=1 FL=1|tara:strand:- start:1279 stop:1590 length:312 start_codon:yes stop_codon:yes gene_type:complete
MTIQIPEQELCRVNGDTVTVLLPSTTLTLSMEEADSLNCILQTDLLHGLFEEMHGNEVGETVLIADVVVSQNEAWELHRSLENIVGVAKEFYHDRVNWIDEGF